MHGPGSTPMHPRSKICSGALEQSIRELCHCGTVIRIEISQCTELYERIRIGSVQNEKLCL